VTVATNRPCSVKEFRSPGIRDAAIAG